VGLHVDSVIPPAASYNAWCIFVDDLGIITDIIPHLEEVSSFILTATVKAVLMQPKWVWNPSGWEVSVVKVR
jgi:hypothetical protein